MKILLLAVLTLGLMVVPVEAHHRDNHQGGTKATVVAIPDVTVIGTTIRIMGCNYSTRNSAVAEITHDAIHNGVRTDILGIWVWAQDLNDCEAGRIDFPYQTHELGIHTIQIFQTKGRKNRNPVLVAEGIFEAVP